MADVVFKDLCLDVTDVGVAAEFWAPTTGLRRAPDRPRLDGETPEQSIWLNVVPEPKTVKNRVHLDVDVLAVEEVERRGARVQQPYDGWTVLTDPEGAEFCAFVRERVGAYRICEVAVDAGDAEAITRWWADRFGVAARHDDAEGPWWWLEAPPMPWPLVFGPVPESKTVKNRAHWDLWGHTPTLLAAGATLLRGRDDEIDWDVLADPDGNEFCVFSRG